MSASHDEAELEAVVVLFLELVQRERNRKRTLQVFELLDEPVKVELDELVKVLAPLLR